jgi:hypothetical protein
MLAQMTPTARRQGRKNAMIFLIASLVVWCVITAAVVLIFHQSIFRAFGVSGLALGGVAMLVFYGTWLYGRSAGGRVALDCGPHPTRTMFLAMAVLISISVLSMGLIDGLEFIGRWIDEEATSTSSFFSIGAFVFLMLTVPFDLIMASGRLQVRENGIWPYCGLVRWNKIVSYSWANDGTLLIRARKSFFSWTGGTLPVSVPPERKQAVEELLAKHCPAAANA